ncbi:MAG: hypothetical protein LBL23_02720 [Coriobacteriales bacterium]|jgi:predicted DNA binding CopG/RHH family protein|nr:hypothetical protein [Coriobacteriales bacterium]
MKNDDYLDSEEQQLIESLEGKGWQSIGPERMDGFVKAAQTTLAKDRRMNIRISSKDYEGIRMKAAEEGLPYQTLAASILHKYVSGRLVDAK